MITLLKEKYDETDDDNRKIKPNFFGKIARMKGRYDSEHNSYKFQCATMDYVQRCVNRFRNKRRELSFIPFSDLLSLDEYDSSSVNYRQVESAVGSVRQFMVDTLRIWESEENGWDYHVKREKAEEAKVKCNNFIKSLKLNKHTVFRLLLSIESDLNADIKRRLLNLLFSAPNESFITALKTSKTYVGVLSSDELGDIEIFGVRYSVRDSCVSGDNRL